MKAARAPGIGLAVALAIAALDQLSKNLLLYGYDFIHLGRLARIEVAPFLDLVMVWNRGISYGLLQTDGGLGTLILTAISLLAAAGFGWWLWRTERVLLAVGLGLIIGGALGNAIDRVRFGAVVDFFHFHALGYGWYVFNVADAAISVGVAVLLLESLFRPEAPREQVRE
jgi:signal peptidase II